MAYYKDPDQVECPKCGSYACRGDCIKGPEDTEYRTLDTNEVITLWGMHEDGYTYVVGYNGRDGWLSSLLFTPEGCLYGKESRRIR